MRGFKNVLKTVNPRLRLWKEYTYVYTYEIESKIFVFQSFSAYKNDWLFTDMMKRQLEAIFGVGFAVARLKKNKLYRLCLQKSFPNR